MARTDRGRKRTWRFRLNEGTILEVSAPEGPTEKQVRRRGRLSLVLGVAALALGLVAIASADSVRSDSDIIQAGVQNSAITVNLAAGGSTAVSVGVQVVSSGSVHATFPVAITASTANTVGTTLGSLSPTALSVSGYGDAGEATTQVSISAPSTGLTCGVNNAFSGRVVFTTSASGFQGSNNTDFVNVNVNVAGPSCPPSDTDPPVITHGVGTPNYVDGSDTYVTSATTLNFNVNEADHGDSGLKSCVVAVDGPATDDGSFTCVEGNNNYTLSTTAPLSLASTPDDASYANIANATDNEDNAAAEDSFTVILDNTAPTFGTCTGGPFYLGSGDQAVSITANDTGSGLDAANSTLGGTVDTSTIGTKTVNYAAKDNLGNTANTSCNYSVIFNFHGFFRPVDNQPAINVVKAGSAIPVKFDLSGDQGLGIFAAGSPSSVRVACDAGADQDPVEETVTAGGSSLNYDSSVNLPYGQYIYVWKTDKAWATTCRRLDVKLIDGTTHSANFKFTK